MNITDVIALAKQGYKPNDIKELIALTSEENNGNVSEKLSEPDNETEAGEDNKPVDYEALYNEAIKENESLKANIGKLNDDLKQAQKNNIKKDVSSNNTIETSEEIWTNFLKRR